MYDLIDAHRERLCRAEDLLRRELTQAQQEFELRRDKAFGVYNGEIAASEAELELSIQRRMDAFRGALAAGTAVVATAVAAAATTAIPTPEEDLDEVEHENV